MLLAQPAAELRIWAWQAHFQSPVLAIKRIKIPRMTAKQSKKFAFVYSKPLPFQIYDVTTGRLIMTLVDQDRSNHYSRNRATFHPTDEMVLNDGLLWDVRSATVIHKFDKLNPHISGLFHPRGLEVIINTEVVRLSIFSILIIGFIWISF